MAKITKVPDGPLVKKKGPFKGSTLRAGGKIKKAQLGTLVKKGAKAVGLGTAAAAGASSASSCSSGHCFHKKSRWTHNGRRKNGGPIKKAQNGTSEYSDPKPLFDKIKKTKDSIDNAKIKLEEKKFKSNTNYLKAKLKNEQSMMNSKKAKAGAMIKRADGSMSQRGLWDNIRANKGSGKKPTAAMLKQEKKIKAKK